MIPQASSSPQEPHRRSFPPLLIYFLFFFLSLLFWELLLGRLMHTGGQQWYFLLFLPAQALVPTLLCGYPRARRLNRLLPVLVTLLLSAYYLTQLIYLRTFGSLLSVSLMGMGGEALGNFAWAMVPVLKSSVGYIALFLLPLLLSLLLFAVGRGAAGGYSGLLRLLLPFAAAGLWMLGSAALPLWGKGAATPYTAYHSSYVDTDTSATRLGAMTTTLLEGYSYYFGGSKAASTPLLGDFTSVAPAPSSPAEGESSAEEPDLPAMNTLEALDFAALESATDDEKLQELCRYFAAQSGTAQNPYTGLFEGYNLIYICAESFSSYALDPDVTPTLCRLASEGIILKNYYNSFRNTTTNGEYALLTGYWPDVSRNASDGTAVGSMPQSADKYMPFGLGTLFNEQGVVSRGYHNYLGKYYLRNKSLPNLGYTCKFMGAGMSFTTNWPASDLEMMEQSVDDYIHEDRFHAYYMTFSGHGAYTLSNCMASRNYRAVYSIVTQRGDSYTSHAVCYLACNRELDRAMEYLLAKLEEAGKLESTVIVLAGDHTPYYLPAEDMATLAGHKVDTSFELYHDPCIIWCGALEEPIVCEEYCCNVDILPTVLNLFGIEYDSRLFPGTDVFSDGLHIAALYNKSFVTDLFRYNAVSDVLETPDGSARVEDEELRAQADKISQLISSRYAASLRMQETDFCRFVWQESGLLDSDDAAP